MDVLDRPFRMWCERPLRASPGALSAATSKRLPWSSTHCRSNSLRPCF